MGVLNFLGIGKEIKEPVDAIGGALDALFTSDEERLTAEQMKERLKQKPLLLQASLDAIYAKSSNLFVSAARPFNVYVAGFNMFSANIAIVWFNKDVPSWYADASVTAFIGALGLYGASRTIEKLNNKAK